MKGVSGGVLQLLTSGSDLYVAGFFVQAGDQAAHHRARWNGNVVSARPAESGTLQIALPRNSGRGHLQVEQVPA